MDNIFKRLAKKITKKVEKEERGRDPLASYRITGLNKLAKDEGGYGTSTLAGAAGGLTGGAIMSLPRALSHQGISSRGLAARLGLSTAGGALLGAGAEYNERRRKAKKKKAAAAPNPSEDKAPRRDYARPEMSDIKVAVVHELMRKARS